MDTLADALRQDFDLDVSGRPDLYLVKTLDEIEAVKRHTGVTLRRATGWYTYSGYRGGRPGIYGATRGGPSELVAHEFIHYALDNSLP